MNKDIPTNIASGGDESVLLRLQDLQAVFREKLKLTDEAGSWLQNRRKRKAPTAETLEKETSVNQDSAERSTKRSRFVHNVFYLAHIQH